MPTLSGENARCERLRGPEKKKHRRTHFAAKSPVFFGTFSCDPR